MANMGTAFSDVQRTRGVESAYRSYPRRKLSSGLLRAFPKVRKHSNIHLLPYPLVSDKSAIDPSSPASAQSSTTSATRTSLGRAPSPSHQSAVHALVITDEASPLHLRSTRIIRRTAMHLGVQHRAGRGRVVPVIQCWMVLGRIPAESPSGKQPSASVRPVAR
jgi:hypothetical protein